MVRIVTINGSLRAHSSNGALLRAAKSVAPPGVELVEYRGMGELPHFNPDLDEEGMEPPPMVAALRTLLIESDAVVISCPEYAHGVPGAMKNLLDWLVSTGELVMKPVALWNASPSGGAFAQAALLETLRTMNWNVIAEASRTEPFVKRKIVGEVEDREVLEELRAALVALSARQSAG